MSYLRIKKNIEFFDVFTTFIEIQQIIMIIRGSDCYFQQICSVISCLGKFRVSLLQRHLQSFKSAIHECPCYKREATITITITIPGPKGKPPSPSPSSSETLSETTRILFIIIIDITCLYICAPVGF